MMSSQTYEELMQNHLSLSAEIERHIESLNKLYAKFIECNTSLHIDTLRRLATLESDKATGPKSYNYVNMRHIVECTQRRLTHMENRCSAFDGRLCDVEEKLGIGLDVVDSAYNPWAFAKNMNESSESTFSNI